MEILRDIAVVIWHFLLASPEATAVLVTFILTLIPGPFRKIVESFINWFLTRQRQHLEHQKQTIAKMAVLAAEDYKQQLYKAQVDPAESGRRALDEAVRVAREYGLFETDPDAEARIRAKYQELKGDDTLL